MPSTKLVHINTDCAATRFSTLHCKYFPDRESCMNSTGGAKSSRGSQNNAGLIPPLGALALWLLSP